MNCKKCGASIADGNRFCLYCGAEVEDPANKNVAPNISFGTPADLPSLEKNEKKPVVDDWEETQQVSCATDYFSRAGSLEDKPAACVPVQPPHRENEPQEEEPQGDELREEEPVLVAPVVYCPYCGGPLDSDAVFCNNCGKKLSVSPAEKAAKKTKGIKAPKRPKKGIVAAAAVALLLVVVLIVGSVTNWFGATGPADQIASAVKNMLTAENFTVDFEYTYNVYREWGIKAKGTAYVSIDPEKRELTIYADLTADGESGILAIYDGYYIVSSSGKCWGYDISEELDACFNAYEEITVNDFSWEDFIDSGSYEGAYDDVKEDIDFDELDICLAAYVKKLNDEKWLEKNTGYSAEKDGGVTMHCFNPDIYTFLKASAAEFENVFIDEELYGEMHDGITDLRSGSKYTDTNIVFGVKRGKLVHFEGEVSGSYDGLTEGDELHIAADFYDFGKTKFDTEELEDMLAEVLRQYD